VFEASVSPDALSHVGERWDMLLTVALALPLYVSAPAATPLAAIMVHKGFSIGAVLTFLIVGPGANLAVLGLLRRQLGLRAALAFVLGLLGFAVVVGLLVRWIVPQNCVPALHSLATHHHSWLEWACAVALASLIVASMARVGPRAWFATISFTGASAEPHATASQSCR
jgi:hypothetical protein